MQLGTVPKNYCTTHVKAKICNSNGKLAGDNCKDVSEKVFITRENSESDTRWKKATDAKYMLPTEKCEDCKSEPEKDPNENNKPNDNTKPEDGNNNQQKPNNNNNNSNNNNNNNNNSNNNNNNNNTNNEGGNNTNKPTNTNTNNNNTNTSKEPKKENN